MTPLPATLTAAAVSMAASTAPDPDSKAPTAPSAALLAEQLRLSVTIADAESVAAIREQCTHAHTCHDTGQTWLDTRVLLSADEHCAQVIDMNILVLQYARMRGLIYHQQGAPHLVRIARHALAL